MRRILAIARRPAVWLFAVSFALWLWLLGANVPPPPAHVIATGEADYEAWIDGAPSGWTELLDVADDGSAVTSVVVHCPGKYYSTTDTRPRVLDTRTGEDRTHEWWTDADGKPGPEWCAVWRTELWQHPQGRTFLRDEVAWDALRKRPPATLWKDRLWLYDWSSRTDRFSPDGRLLAYPTRDGQPAERRDADGTAVEDVRTGRRVASLPGVTDPIDLAPGGRVAVARKCPKERDGEQPRLAVWHLGTATVRAELSLPDTLLCRTHFSPDGRYLFADYLVWDHFPDCSVRWWDADIGAQIGQVDGADDFALTAGGRVLVTKPTPLKRNRATESSRLYFWDVTTGSSLGEWNLGGRGDGSGRYRFVGSDGNRLLVATFDPEHGRRRSLLGRAGDKIHEWTVGGPPPDREQVVVWDTAERREVLRVPGKRPALSANGRWLATIDPQGTIRVWEVPAHPPWGVLLWYSLIAAACTTAAVLVTLHAFRWGWRLAWGWWPGRVVRWAWRSRVRRRWIVALGGCVVVTLGGWVAYAVVADQARAHLQAVFREVESTDGLTDADVAARVGGPADAGPPTDTGLSKSGGGRVGETTVRRWTRFGAEMDVHFGPDGTVWAVYFGQPDPLDEQLARWLGL